MLFATDVALALHLAVNRVVGILETGGRAALLRTAKEILRTKMERRSRLAC
jgi:hypothetical protein